MFLAGSVLVFFDCLMYFMCNSRGNSLALQSVSTSWSCGFEWLLALVQAGMLLAAVGSSTSLSVEVLLGMCSLFSSFVCDVVFIVLSFSPCVFAG